MKISVQSGQLLPAFPADDPETIETFFRQLRQAGIDGVDFNLNRGLTYDTIVRGTPGGLFDLPVEAIFEKLEPYRAAAARAGVEFVQMHAPFPSYTPRGAQINDYVLQAIEKSIAVCGHFGCPYLIVHPAYLEYDRVLDKAEEWQLNRRMYAALLPALLEYKVVACLENMFTARNRRIYAACCSNMMEAAQYIDALNDLAGEERFAFCFDTGHALLLGLEMYTALQCLGKRVRTLHIHDNNGLEDQHVLPHMGILDWTRFAQGLRSIGYQGVLSFETFHVFELFGKDCVRECLALTAAVGRDLERAIACP